jgi:uncharacterized phage protein (TIGR01671 family)
MRLIKFRGKKVDGGEWVFGDLIQVPENILNGFKTQILVFEGIESGDPLFEQYDVIPETVGQYTGYEDIEGKELYDGDFVKYQFLRYRKPVVVLTKIIWQYNGFYIERNETKVIDSRALTLSHNQFSLAGNIHDNPELI